jgi:hypothetical protein
MPRQTVQQYLNVPEEWKVKENIKHSIILTPNKEDIRKAKRRDPQACALHNAACRMFGIPNCAIGGRWAYIPQKDEKGKFYIARMQAPVKTRAAIRKFDETGKMPEGGFVFAPIAESHTYKRKKVYNATYQYNKPETVVAAKSGKSSKITLKMTAKGPRQRVITKQRLAPLRAIPRVLSSPGK